MFSGQKFTSDKTRAGQVRYMSDYLLKSDYVKEFRFKTSIDRTVMDQYYETYIKKEVKNGHKKDRYIYYIKKSEPSLISIHNMISKSMAPPCSSSVFSYLEDMSSRDVAERHVKSRWLYKLDIKDYFPSITREMIEELYRDWFANDKTLNVSLRTATIIAVLCTRTDLRPASAGGNQTSAILPIGISPSSPISNSILYDFDKWVEDNLPKGCTYSRYSDNLFISSKRKEGVPSSFRDDTVARMESLSIAGIAPFKINKDKTQYIPRWRSQRILGTVVNEKVNIPKAKAMKTRSALNHLYYDVQALYADLESGKVKRRDYAWKKYNAINSRSRVVFGNLSYFQAINPDKYQRYSSHHHAIKISLENCRDHIMRMGGDKAK